MKKNVLFGLIVFYGYLGFSQQLPQYTQYLINDYVMNPAIGGSKEYTEAKANQRMQWVGIQDAPRTFIFSTHGSTHSGKVGLGGYVFSDITGPTRRTGFRASYSYHFNVSRNSKISLGLSGGVLQYALDGSKLDLKESNDLALSNTFETVFLPDAGAGVLYYSKNYFVSFSVPQLFGAKIQFYDDYEQTQSKLTQHYFLAAGYTFKFGSFGVQPSFLYKYANPFSQLEGTLRFLYDEVIWLGANFRQNDGIGVLLGYSFLENFMFGYSYDFPTGDFSKYSVGSHEVMLGIKFFKKD